MTNITKHFLAIKKVVKAFVPVGVVAPAAFGLSFALYGAAVEPASALPSFARQTGQPCAACHTAFPQLTPFGRRFKLGGYTLEGGETRDLPQISFMLQSTFTRYGTGLNAPSGIYTVPSPDGGWPNQNNFLDLAQQSSVFYGGKVYGNVGAFIQATFSNDYGRSFGWDLTDVRYADTIKINNIDVLYGLTANNSPTVQDPWNTTPVWSSPFIGSSFALSPVATTMIEGFGAGQAVGGGAYVFVNDMFYAELSGYGSLTPNAQNKLGAGFLGFAIDGIAPYYRGAVEYNWGDHSLMVGAYGMIANVIPGTAYGLSGNTYGFGTNHIYDAGFDSQYQWITEKHAVTVRANYIFEQQNMNALSGISVANGGLPTNPTDYLRSLKLGVEYVYDHTYSLTGTYFQITGSPDAIVYSNNVYTSPNSSGFIIDAAYLPFSHGGPDIWPWFNTRLGVSYTIFTKFDGGSNNIDPVNCWGCRNAADNNTLLIYAFTAF